MEYSAYSLLLTAYSLLCIGLAGCGGLRIEKTLMARPGDVLSYGGNHERTARYDASLADSLVEIWERDLSAGIGTGTPLLLDSIVLGGNLRGDLYAYDIRTGKSIGSVRLTDAVPGSPVVDQNVVVMPSSGSQESLIAYNLSTGRVVWRKSYGEVEMSPLLMSAEVFFGTLTGKAYCLDASMGNLVWKFEIPENTRFNGFRSSPSANDSLVFFGCDDGSLYALRTRDGSLSWRSSVDGPIVGGSALAYGTVIVATTHGSIVAFDAATGKQRWDYRTEAPIFSPPAVCNDTLVIGGIDGYVRAFRVENGTLLWQTSVEGPVNAAAAIAGDKVYVGTLKKRFFALRLSDGRIVMSKELDGRVASPPVVGYQKVLVATDEYTLYCFGRGKE